ncbi:MAG TPA: hypothetical protein VKD72_23555 [Gemmataceae bacterium]|nr:hypothetical protein [Gemmataceae bacterium]
MISEYGRDLSDQNRPIRDAWAERPGKPIRIRIQPAIFRLVKGRSSQYKVWPNIHWTLECERPEEAYQLREALRLFFDTTNRTGGLDAVVRALRAVEAPGKKTADDKEGAA